MPYSPGETVICQSENYSTLTGELTDPDTITITVKNPGGSIVVTEEVPTNDSTGKYHYNYLLSAEASKGNYKIIWTAVKDTIKTITHDSFEVVA